MKDSIKTGLELKRLQTLLEAARLLNSTLELRELTGIILEVVREEVPVERLSVFVVDGARNVVQSLVAQGIENTQIVMPLGAGIAGTVALTGEVLDIPDAYADYRFDSTFDVKFGYRTRDLFCLPVCNRQGEVVGVLELLNRARPIVAADREFLLGISTYIGLALQNAWLHAQLQATGRFEEELFALRERLAETERVSLMAEVFGSIVHEINNPLAFAMGYAELARDQRELPAQVRAYLEKVKLGIDQTAAAAGKFQDFVEQQKHERSVIHLDHALRQISELRARDWARNNIQTALVIEAAPPVLAQENQMHLVLLYLIKNAEDALLRSTADRMLRIRLWGDEQQVNIEIHDNGPGLPPDAQQRLFQLSLTTDSNGSAMGLGLAIASSIVRQHRGHIRFHSKPGQGTTFIVELPGHAQG